MQHRRHGNPLKWAMALAALVMTLGGCENAVGLPDGSADAEAAEPSAYISGSTPVGQLAVVSSRAGNPEVYVVRADGTGLKRLTWRSADDRDPAWSPDGGRIAFASNRNGGYGIHVMSADGSNATAWTRSSATHSYHFNPSWRPNGAAVAFSLLHLGSAAIATVGSAGGAITFLPDAPGYDDQPDWSRDGQRIAFVSDRAAYDFTYDIFTMNADGSAQTQLTNGNFFWPNLRLTLHPAWSPDGTKIAYVYGKVVNTSDVRFRVAIMTADGSFIKNLAWAGDIPWTETLDPGSLTWSPDGRWIAYTRVDCDLITGASCTKVKSVRYVSLDGTIKGRILSNAHSPAWRP